MIPPHFDRPPLVQVYQAADDPFSHYGGHIAEIDCFVKYGGSMLPPVRANRIQFHEKLAPLFEPHRYKILYGGRGGVKSWSIARALLILGQQKRLRILCGREFMNTMEDSVHRLLKDQIELLGLSDWYHVTAKSITAPNGTMFRFVGLGDMSTGASRTKLKSFESFDILWVEEAESVTDRTWEVIIPTIRKKGSEIWISYNPNLASDATYQRFHPDGTGIPAGAAVIELNWRENLWFTDEMRFEKDHAFLTDPEAAAHIWDGHLRMHADACIFKDKYIVHDFDTPADAVFHHGVDWGFAIDPQVILRSYITGSIGEEELWIDREGWQVGLEINDTAAMWDQTVPTARKWPIKADSARPELISYMRRQGFNIEAAEKWEGCVEDGIAHLRAFRKIHIHTRCRHTADEFKLYSYKIDKATGQILPMAVDKHNHCPDAERYALDGFIQRRGLLGMWERLGA